MATTLGTSFSTDEKVVTQADVKLLGSMVKSLDKFDQEKYEQFLFSDSTSPKVMWQYCKVSAKTGYQVTLKTSQRRTSSKVNRKIVTKANGLNFLETPIVSYGANIICANVS